MNRCKTSILKEGKKQKIKSKTTYGKMTEIQAKDSSWGTASEPYWADPSAEE